MNLYIMIDVRFGKPELKSNLPGMGRAEKKGRNKNEKEKNFQLVDGFGYVPVRIGRMREQADRQWQWQ